jgi:hypothetical protein
MKRRKELYEVLHPEAALGENQHTRVCHNGEPSERFIKATATSFSTRSGMIGRPTNYMSRQLRECLETRGVRLVQHNRLERNSLREAAKSAYTARATCWREHPQTIAR